MYLCVQPIVRQRDRAGQADEEQIIHATRSAAFATGGFFKSEAWSGERTRSTVQRCRSGSSGCCTAQKPISAATQFSSAIVCKSRLDEPQRAELMQLPHATRNNESLNMVHPNGHSATFGL